MPKCTGCHANRSLPKLGLCTFCNSRLAALGKDYDRTATEMYHELVKDGGYKALEQLARPEHRVEHPALSLARAEAKKTLRCTYATVQGVHYTFEPILVGLDVQVREHKTPTGNGRGAA